MAIKEYKQPIHHLQKGENLRAAHYRDKFYTFNGNLTEFAEHLKQKWYSFGNDSAKKQEYFYKYDVDRNCYPTFNIISKWSACDNWFERRVSFRNQRQEEIDEYALQSDLENKEEYIDLQAELRIKLLRKAIELLDNDMLNGTQAQGYMSANKHLQDAQNRERGEAKDINQTNMEATVETESKLAHDFNDDILGVIGDAIERRNTNGIG